MADLRSGIVKILIATDVVSRGIDIEDISLVINYDFPIYMEEYVHRVGRTGRAGRSGRSLSLFTEKDRSNASSLIGILVKSAQPVPNELYSMVEG